MTTSQEYPMATSPYLPPPPVKPWRGLAIAGFVVALVGCVFGLIPITFLFAWICGVIGLVFGIIGRRHGLGKASIVLGVVAIILGIIGYVIVANATTKLQKDLNSLSSVAAAPAVPGALAIPTAGNTDADLYVQAVQEATGLTGGPYTDAQVTTYGEEACQDGAGTNAIVAASQLQTDENLPPYDAGYIAGAAAALLCPS
jgi:hypothetical protein